MAGMRIEDDEAQQQVRRQLEMVEQLTAANGQAPNNDPAFAAGEVDEKNRIEAEEIKHAAAMADVVGAIDAKIQAEGSSEQVTSGDESISKVDGTTRSEAAVDAAHKQEDRFGVGLNGDKLPPSIDSPQPEGQSVADLQNWLKIQQGKIRG